MAHRGVWLNGSFPTSWKTLRTNLHEFQRRVHPEQLQGDGDVLSPRLFSQSKHHRVNPFMLSSRPTHRTLEAVDPLVLVSRGQIDDEYKGDLNKVDGYLDPWRCRRCCRTRHCLWDFTNEWLLPGYNTSGTIHFVINQVGFTTDFDSRTAIYRGRVAKMVDNPCCT